jgi:chemotaxis protein MotB
MRARSRIAFVAGISLLASSGCAINFAKRSPWDIEQLAELSAQLEQFKNLAQLKAEEADELRRAKALLEQQLSSSEANIGYDERGLVARLLDQVLFDSGKAELRTGARGVLDKVAQVLKEVPSQPIGVEGHTDNVPIKLSGWASNQALSEARAEAVADYCIAQHGLDPSRFTPIGYGDSRPLASNATDAGRQKNRRVEVIILPRASEQAYHDEAQRVSEAGPAYAK